MAFRAMHARWGPVFAHLPDLGCGRRWEDVWRARLPEPLVCVECAHPMRAKLSPHGLRFFAHDPGAPNCEVAGESVAHHLLKLELSSAARAAGAHTEMEVRGPGGSWRADVMASDPAGAWRMALEAQLSSIALDDITARTERMRGDGVSSVWASDRPRPPWLHQVPSVRLESAETGGPVVVEGLGQHSMIIGWQRQRSAVPLVDFVRGVFTGGLVQVYPGPGAGGHYWGSEWRRGRPPSRRPSVSFWSSREDARAALVGEHVFRDARVYPRIADQRLPEYAMGVLIGIPGRLYGAISPRPSLIQPVRDRVSGLVLFVESEQERRELAEQTYPGQQIVVLPTGQRPQA